MKNIIKLIRPHQYIKNLFIFMPLFFVGQITNTELLLSASLAFVAFSLSASAVYIINDYRDIEDDRLHPSKKYRPLASGVISKKTALIIMVSLFFVSLTAMATLSLHALLILCAYIILNVAYSFHFKHVAIIDITIIATGFVLRLFVGSSVTETPLSMWIVIMTFLIALFMALAKRRDDVLIFINTGKKMRKVVDGYSLQLIDGAMIMMGSVVIMAYFLYTTSAPVTARLHSEHLYLTALFVIIGILRYLQIALVKNDSGSPTRIILQDRLMQFSILAWLASFAWIIYI